MKGKWVLRALLAGVMMMSLVLAGCEGDDGDDGAPGPPGQDVDPAVVNSLQDQADQATEDSKEALDAVADLTELGHPADLEKPIVSNVVVARDAENNLTVTFDVTEADGTTPLSGIGSENGSSSSDIRTYFAAIVPAGTETANTPLSTWTTAFPENWAELRGSTDGVVLSEPAAGSYQVEIPAAIGFDMIGGADAPETTADQKQRLYVRADARDFEGFNRTMAVVDFDMPAQGAATAALEDGDTTRTIVVKEACTQCHNDPLQEAAHGGGYQSPQVCVMCHTPIGERGDEMQETGAWSANIFHKIHAAIFMDAFPDRVTEDGYAGVTYPSDIRDCERCHFDAGQDMADAWKTNPSREACGSCHDMDVIHPNISDSTLCAGCHGPEGTGGFAPSVALAHAIVDPATYFAEVTLSADANADGVYDVGETPVVTLTITDADGNILDPTIEPVVPGEDSGFSRANLYVYGPRAYPVPVMKPESTTDPDFDPTLGPPTQGTSILASNAATDANVLTDATAFKYQLLPVTADMEPGTYFVQAYATDLSLTPVEYRYRTSVSQFGWALASFQVGTADPEPRVSGDCYTCHQENSWGTFYHRGYFAADGCIACHDQSGNHANYLSNRVHAVHSANSYGDLLLIEDGVTGLWEEITYPQDVVTCTGCHTESDSYKTNMYLEACLGCHGEETGGVEAHMETNTTEAGVGACITCHGEGKSAAIN